MFMACLKYKILNMLRIHVINKILYFVMFTHVGYIIYQIKYSETCI